MRVWYDTEREMYINEGQLRQEFEEAKEVEGTTAETFEEYVDNCMAHNNGTLECTNEE